MFSIHMFICLWSGSFALSTGNPIVGPAAFPAPEEGKCSSIAREIRGGFQPSTP